MRQLRSRPYRVLFVLAMLYVLSTTELLRRVKPELVKFHSGQEVVQNVKLTERDLRGNGSGQENATKPCSGELRYAFPDVRAPNPDAWQTVIPGRLFAYSAFLDTRLDGVHFVRIVVIKHSRYREPITCQLWYHVDGQSTLVEGRVFIFPEQPKTTYKTGFLECKLPSGKPGYDESPVAVSIATESCDSLQQNLMTIHSTESKSWETTYNFTVCLGGPLKFGLNNTNQLTEWLEMNAMFGADHFILYNHSASSDIKTYIEYYTRTRKLIELLPWQLPNSLEKPREMKNFGHLGLVNDCLYRTMYQSAMTVFMDTDEFIVPREQGIKTWHDMLEKAACLDAFFISVKNVFFKKEWQNDEQSDNNERLKKLDLVTQLKTKRESKIWPHPSRSKYMVRPESVKVTGIHKTWYMLPNSAKRCKLKENAALVHHYRWWDDPSPNWIVDRTMIQYQQPLVSKVEQVHEYIREHWTP